MHYTENKKGDDLSMAAEIFCNNCGAANPANAPLCWACGRAPTSNNQPALLNQRYRVLDQLGAGGQGAVYRVEDTTLANRLLAAKKLDLASIPPKDHQDSITAFKQEATMLAGLQHPNLPRIYEYFMENSDYYLVMDFIEGETLTDYIQNLPSPILPPVKVLKIGLQLATVLDYLHTRQPAIVFRDLKPDNIMITSKGEIYLIDFGIARHFKPGQSGDTIRWGTLEYASPEQLAGKQTSAHSDIYSLGVVFHQLLSGDEPRMPVQFAPLKIANNDLEKLVMRMLKRDKQERPANMAEVMKELTRIARAFQQQKAASPVWQPSQSNKKVPRTPAASPPPKPLPPKKPGELHYAHAHTSRSIHALAWSPDGQRLAALGEDPVQVLVWNALTQKEIAARSDFKRRLQALAWSPDSRLLGLAGNDRTVHLWRPGGGYAREYADHRNWVQTLAWSPNGQQIASGDANKQIHIWETATGQPYLVYRDHTGAVRALVFSPDGTRIASTDENENAVQIWDATNGKLLARYTAHQREISSLAWSSDSRQIVSGSWDRTLHVWEASSGRQVARYTGHQGLITAVAWSPASKLIASASMDKTVQIWRPQTLQPLFIYHGHTTGVNALAWSPDGARLASAGDETAVHVWQAS